MLRYATPWFLVAALCTVMLLRFVGLQLERKRRIVPLYLKYYTWFYLLLLILMLAALISTVCDVMRVSGWLDPESIELRVKGRLFAEEGAERWREVLDLWREEASLEDYPMLRWFSMSCPLYLLATFVVCVVHTHRHMIYMDRTLCSRAQNLHDKTIRILALPMVYGLMSFEGVVRMWGVVIDQTSTRHHFQHFDDRLRYQLDMYEACFMVGDLYESYALHVFGALTIFVLNQKISRKVSTAKEAMSAMSMMSMTASMGTRPDGASEDVQGLDGTPLSEATPVPDASYELDAHFSRPRESYAEVETAFTELMNELKGLTMLGIKLFCLTCFLQAFYKLIVMTLGFYDFFPAWFNTDTHNQPPGVFQRPDVKKGAHHFFYGAGFVASFAAIGNVVEVERGFHKNLQEFSPFLKFWGVKVLVSIAFLQTLVLLIMPPFSGWSETRQNIFYASMLCLECFLISLFHLKSWAPRESWYGSMGDLADGYSPMADKNAGTTSESLPSESSDSSFGP